MIMVPGAVTSFGHAAFFGVWRLRRCAAVAPATRIASSGSVWFVAFLRPWLPRPLPFRRWLVLRARGVYAGDVDAALRNLWALQRN